MYKLSDIKNINREHFKSDFSYFVIESVIQGHTMADAYIDKPDNPSFTIVWDGKHNIYCGGTAEKDILLQAVGFIKNDILTQQVRQERGIVKVMYENPQWNEALLEGTKELEPNIYPRSVYRHKLDSIPDFQCRDDSMIIKRIDQEMVDGKLKNLDGLKEELIQMWGSIESFLEKGFGFCALKEDSIAAWCTGEYLSEAWCGIGIETYEAYQQQGVATATTIEMLKYCKAINKIPHWDCWKNNIPSVKTAEKVGFEKLTDYDIVFLRL